MSRKVERKAHTLLLAAITAVLCAACGPAGPDRKGEEDSAAARAPSAQDAAVSASARIFVQTFYDEYTPAARKTARVPAWYTFLARTPAPFAPALLSALRADSSARATAAVGALDFDPFLNSQDPCEWYQAAGTRTRGAALLVDVHAVCGGNRKEQPGVVAELIQAGNSWLFSNLHYPQNNTDLLTVLTQLSDDRKR